MRSITATLIAMLWTMPASVALAEDGAADLEIVAAEVAAATDGTPATLREQLQARLQKVGSDGVVCQGDERAACREQLRAKARECLQHARREGKTPSTDEGTDLGLSLMLMAKSAQGGGVEAAEIVKLALSKQWKAGELAAVAEQLEGMGKKATWRHQTTSMVRECVADSSCTAEQAHVAAAVMKQASASADADARSARRTIRTELRAEKGEQAITGTELRARLQTRLRLHKDTESIGSGEQQRHRYRGQMDGEQRRGGSYGGKQSTGIADGRGPETTDQSSKNR